MSGKRLRALSPPGPAADAGGGGQRRRMADGADSGSLADPGLANDISQAAASQPGDLPPGLLPGTGDGSVVRRTAGGWRVGDDELPDLTCAMVLADLIAAELPTQIQAAIQPGAPAPAAPQPAAQHASSQANGHNRGLGHSHANGHNQGDGKHAKGSGCTPGTVDRVPVEDGLPAAEADRLRATVGQLEHALTARIRIEQAIGVLSERHRIRPRQAFEQLRTAARNRGRRVIDIAGDVVASATNPLLQLPEELSRQRSGSRHARTPRPLRAD